MIAGASAALVGRMIRGNPRGVKSGLTYRYMAYSKTGSTLARGKNSSDVVGVGPRLIVDFVARRYAVQGYYPPARIYNWTPWKSRQVPDPRTLLPNPDAQKNFRHARIHRLPKPGECEIGLVSQDNCYRKATVSVEMGLKRGTPLRVCQRHADWIKRMRGNPCGSRSNIDPNELLKKRARRLAAVMGYRVSMASPTGHGTGIYMYVDRKGIDWDSIPLARTWKDSVYKLEEMYLKRTGRRLRATGDIGPYGWQKNPCGSRKNPMKTGKWAGWTLIENGFLKDFSAGQATITLARHDSAAPTIWEWVIFDRGAGSVRRRGWAVWRCSGRAARGGSRRTPEPRWRRSPR
jgi:hypothetical protein